MAYRKGVANGYRDMLFMLHRFVTSSKMVSDIAYNPANTGAGGYISAEWAKDAGTDDDWTIDFTSATAFTVTGASHGLQTNTGTVGTPYVSDSDEIGFTVIDGTVSWASGDEITFSTEDGLGSTAKWTTNRYNMVYDSGIDYNGASADKGTIGNPNYDMYSPNEVWTITCTAVEAGVGTFSVIGSESGAKASATTEIAYDNGLVSFIISEGATDWEVDDVIDITIPDWREIYFEAPGNGGSEEIYMGIKTYRDMSASEPVYQWMMNGYTGYNPAADFGSQPGAIDYPATDTIPRCCFRDGPMEYWVVANGRRVMMFCEVNQVIECMYMGFILAYGNPVENPYPLAIGGTTDDENHDYSSQSRYHMSFYSGPCEGQSSGKGTTLRVWDGASWNNIGGESELYLINFSENHHGANWPYFASGLNLTNQQYYASYHWDKITKNSNDSYALFPIIPMVATPDRIVFGELEGLYAVPGSSLAAKDITTIDSVDYILMQNVFRGDQNKWCAFRLE